MLGAEVIAWLESSREWRVVVEVGNWITLGVGALGICASTAHLVWRLLASKSEETRKVVREAMAPFVPILGEGMHEVLASASILAKKIKNGSEPEHLQKWIERGAAARLRIEESRRKARYVLWGITDALKVVALAPDYARHAQNNPSFPVDDMLDRMNSLRSKLDDVIRGCFWDGRQPTSAEVAEVRSAAAHAREVMSRGQPEAELDAE